jgi:hypothetical protein
MHGVTIQKMPIFTMVLICRLPLLEQTVGKGLHNKFDKSEIKKFK